jgi:hypothetical protein
LISDRFTGFLPQHTFTVSIAGFRPETQGPSFIFPKIRAARRANALWGARCPSQRSFLALPVRCFSASFQRYRFAASAPPPQASATSP